MQEVKFSDLATKTDLNRMEQKILNFIKDNGVELTSAKKILRSKEAAEYLGISSSSLQNLRISGALPYSKVNGLLFYDLEDVLRMISKNRNQIS